MKKVMGAMGWPGIDSCGELDNRCDVEGGNPVRAIVRHEPDHVVPCPCGQSERFFTSKDKGALGLHRTTISDAKPHCHERMTEIYYVLGGSGAIVLDGVRHEVEKGSAILIPPGVVHNGEGVYQVIVVYDYPEAHQTDTYHQE